MHYYIFNISDYVTATDYFSNDQDLAYRRMIDLYYSSEKPLPNETQWVSNRIKMGSSIDVVEFVLREKFILMDDNLWHHDICDEKLLKYHSKCEVNRTNGLGGGRPKKNPTGSQSQPNRNPSQEPIANNHKPIKLAVAVADEKSDPSRNPEVWDSEILPYDWQSYAENLQIPDEQIFKSWGRFKTQSKAPWLRLRWQRWIDGEKTDKRARA